MKPPVAIALIAAGILLAVVWNSPAGSADFITDVAGAIGRFLERVANTISTFVGGLAD